MRGLLRPSLLRFTTQQEVEPFLKMQPGAVATLTSVDVPQESSRSIDALTSVFG
jgi:hypothetical protein